MPATLLYHMHGIRGYTFVKQKLVRGRIEFYIEVPHVNLYCPYCGSQNVWQKGCQTRKFYSFPFEKKTTIILDVPRVYCLDCQTTKKDKHTDFATKNTSN